MKKSPYSSFSSNESLERTKSEHSEPKKKARGHCSSSESSSHTQYFRKQRPENEFKRITRDQYINPESESISSSDTFHCIHGSEGKIYTQEGLLKRNLLKVLDPVVIDRKWTAECPVISDWDIAKKIEFLILEPSTIQQLERLQDNLRDFAKISSQGLRVDIVRIFTFIVDYLLDKVPEVPELREPLVLLLQNIAKPILLIEASDVVKYFDMIQHYMGFMGYLLMRVEDDELFDLVSKAILWHVTAPDCKRGEGATSLRHSLAAATILIEPAVRMLAIAASRRFPTFLKLGLILACDTEQNCIEMMKENVIENIFYRFNPYFPVRCLPYYDINPADCQDINLKLGDSTKELRTTMTFLLVLLKTTKNVLESNPSLRAVLPCPDYYSLRCFAWAYRFECRARNHLHERVTLTVIAAALLKCFGKKLSPISVLLMPDIMSLSVFTELPLRDDWIRTVNFNPLQQDVQFKKILICFVVDLLKAFPENKFLVTSRYWLLGMMYLIDPGLDHLRTRWFPAHYAEIRLVAIQALVCTLPLCDYRLVKEYALIRRILWYIEWYTESPYEISTLYWCLRLLQITVYQRNHAVRKTSIQDIFDTHGIIILIRLCYTILEQKVPPVEKSQAVLSVCLRLLTSAAHSDSKRIVTCCVYPNFIWPHCVIAVATRMIDAVLYSLEKHYLISDRWLVALLNFIWEAIIWNNKYRRLFVGNNGIYKLLDIVAVANGLASHLMCDHRLMNDGNIRGVTDALPTLWEGSAWEQMTGPSVQCIALAMICDVVRNGEAVGQLVSWRANLGAAQANPVLVKRGSTIATLLAAVFRDECKKSGIYLSEAGVIKEGVDNPIMKPNAMDALSNQDLCYYKNYSTPVCLSAADLAGSRLPKAFALLQLLSEDLESKVNIADDAYKLYKHIELNAEDETILVLCSHYLTLKLNEVWTEIGLQSSTLANDDIMLVDEFLNVGKSWAKEIIRQQEEVITRNQKKEHAEENSLYAFLGRTRLNIALDALRRVRCLARSADRHRITHALIQDAVFAHHRRSVFAESLDTPLLHTFRAPLDDQNITNQNVKVFSIRSNNQAWLKDYMSSSSTTHGSE